MVVSGVGGCGGPSRLVSVKSLWEHVGLSVGASLAELSSVLLDSAAFASSHVGIVSVFVVVVRGGVGVSVVVVVCCVVVVARVVGIVGVGVGDCALGAITDCLGGVMSTIGSGGNGFMGAGRGSCVVAHLCVVTKCCVLVGGGRVVIVGVGVCLFVEAVVVGV